MAENEDGGSGEKVRALEARVEKLERQVAALSKPKKPAAARAESSYRDSFDALDYPER